MLSSETRRMARVVTTAVQSSQVLAAARARRNEEKMNAFMVEDWDVDCEWVLGT